MWNERYMKYVVQKRGRTLGRHKGLCSGDIIIYCRKIGFCWHWNIGFYYQQVPLLQSGIFLKNCQFHCYMVSQDIQECIQASEQPSTWYYWWGAGVAFPGASNIWETRGGQEDRYKSRWNCRWPCRYWAPDCTFLATLWCLRCTDKLTIKIFGILMALQLNITSLLDKICVKNRFSSVSCWYMSLWSFQALRSQLELL